MSNATVPCPNCDGPCIPECVADRAAAHARTSEKPTPGPWTAGPAYDGGFHDIDAPSTRALICAVEGEADARLIAAAPDLLAACKVALAMHDKFGVDAEPYIDFGMLRAAIAKATGGDL